MPLLRPPDALETDRLVLRDRQVGEADVYRRLWTERDPRVPAHRRIGPDGRPTVEDIAAQLLAEQDEPGPRLLAVERKDSRDVIGYCGLTVRGSGTPDEPELAFELLRAVHGAGYGTEAARAVVGWATEVGYVRLWAEVWDWNLASRRVLAKLGFQETGRVERTSIHGQSLLTVREASPVPGTR
ncbi:GNAT family N-acetyltransferase [Cellulomonas sp. ICMP 17802]|uniref:GNAT family N-acetyltransferase n=1 Tax=Cellulomonas sp. ICMP 17802 TaxID=3239199 RepID=UPI00351AE452